MGDDVDPEPSHPLLSHPHEDEIWDALADVESGRGVGRCLTVHELLQGHPQHVIRWLAMHSVQRIGEFELPERMVLGSLGADSIVTLGSERGSMLLEEMEAAWRAELGDGWGKGEAGE
jgi:hypothetical protein